MKYSDIPQFTPEAAYCVNMPLDYMLTRPARNPSPEGANGPARMVKGWLDEYIEEGLQLNPEFQRGHVWTPAQQTAYMEYRLRGGRMTGRHIYLNHPHWQAIGAAKPGAYAEFVLVDGLQRLTAARAFLQNEVPVFGGHYLKDFEDRPRVCDIDFIVCVNTLRTRKQVLQWYVDLNAGGVVHSDDEIARVRAMIAAA